MRQCPTCGTTMVQWERGRPGNPAWRCPSCSTVRRKAYHDNVEIDPGAPRLAAPESTTPYLQDTDLELHHGDCLEVLRGMPDASVDMVATSPPFYGLRDYGVEGQIGLEETPDEWVERLVAVFRECRRVLADHGTLWVEIGDSYNSRLDGSFGNWDSSQTGKETSKRKIGRNSWSGTWQGAKQKDLLGQPWLLAFALRADGWYLRSEIIWSRPNPMPESVTDRPTKAHSTVFLLAKGQWKSRVVALADLHGEFVHFGNHVGSKNPNVWAHEFGVRLASAILDGAKGEDEFCLPPLDSEIWQESVDDSDRFGVAGLPVIHRAAVYASRLLSSHGTAKEFLCEIDRLGITLAEDGKFLVLRGESFVPLPPGVDRYGERAIAIHDSGEIGEVDFTAHTVKCSWPSGCSYFYDADAIREKFSENTHSKGRGVGIKQEAVSESGTLTAGRNNSSFNNAIRRSHVDMQRPQEETLDGSDGEAPRGPDGRRQTGVKGGENSEQHRDGERWPNPGGANARSVWSIPTEPTPFAHFATWPQALVKRMILAGTSERGKCPKCGAPWMRAVEETDEYREWKQRESGWAQRSGDLDMGRGTGGKGTNSATVPPKSRMLGWSPSCTCDQEPVPCVVLDPFAGSGTTLLVARALGRHSVGIELNEEYCQLVAERTQQLSLLT